MRGNGSQSVNEIKEEWQQVSTKKYENKISESEGASY